MDNGKDSSVTFFLSDILGAKTYAKGKKICALCDMVVLDGEKFAKITHFVINRSWGNPSLLVPTEKIDRVFPYGRKEVWLDIEEVEKYEGEPKEDALLLKDHIEDKKILDTENNEVEVVYDFKIVARGTDLYITDVDVSKYAFLRRLHLTWLSNLIYGPREMNRKGLIPWRYIQPLTNMAPFSGEIKLNVLKERIADMQPVDIAEVLHELPSEHRATVFEGLNAEQASDTLERIRPDVQRELLRSVKKTKIAELINGMTPGQAAEVLGALPSSERRSITEKIDKKHAAKIHAILERTDERVSNFITTGYIHCAPDVTAAELREAYASAAKGKKVVMYIYVVNGEGKLLGVLDIKELLSADANAKLGDIMKSPTAMRTTSTLRKAYLMFSRYDFRAIPVVDEKDKLMGVLPYRDVMQLKHAFVG